MPVTYNPGMFWKRFYGRLCVLILQCIGKLPLRFSRRMTRLLGPPARRLMGRRRRIALRNLELCFPELDGAARQKLLKRHFRHLAEGLAEVAWSWAGPSRIPRGVAAIRGLEHLEAAHAAGGVLIVTGHCTCLEIAGRVLGAERNIAAVYRPLRNPALERFQNAGRGRYAAAMIARDELRAMVRHLRKGGMLWYAPDQDFGRERSEFAPFFGHPAATARAIVDLARLGRAAVVPMYPLKDETGGKITIIIEPALEKFPSGDDVADLRRYNAFLERMIRRAPAQYWWLHRRFKTAPEGMPDRYGR